MLRFISWNTQGKCFERIGENYSKILSKVPGSQNILLVQEAGAPGEIMYDDAEHKIGHTDYHLTIRQQPGALNERCSVAIMHPKEMGKRKVAVCGDYRVTRPFLVFSHVINYIKGEKIIVATMHAIANHAQSPQEVFSVAKYLHEKCGDWVLMGDFNCSPAELHEKIGDNAEIIANDGPTQKSGGTLDYYVISKGHPLRKKMKFSASDNAYGSDHIPIFLDLNV